MSCVQYVMSSAEYFQLKSRHFGQRPWHAMAFLPLVYLCLRHQAVLGSGAMGGWDKLLSVSAGAQCMRDDGSKVAESAKRPTSGTWRGELIVPVVVCEVM